MANIRILLLPVIFCLTASFSSLAGAETLSPQRGLSVFGDLALPEDFKHLAYTNPDAPCGGTLRLRGIGTYDTLNPFSIKGRAPRTDNAPFSLAAMLYAPLMERNYDEPDALYPGIAQAVTVEPDRLWVRFHLDPRAQFQDGSRITPEDVAFSLEALKSDGADPIYRTLLKPIERAEANPSDNTVTFHVDPALSKARRRDVPTLIAGELPILSKAWFTEHPIRDASRAKPVGSGPYRVIEAENTNRLVLERVRDHWANDLPTWRGRWNFERIELDYYLDRTAAFEAFGKGEYDVREEYISRLWATGYTFKAVQDGKIKLLELPDDRLAGVQAWFFNTRRAKFQDRRVREAIGLAFDFEWTNKTMFYGLYDRMSSIFQGGEIAASGSPKPEELAYLTPYRADLPAEVFTDAFAPPVSDGSGRIRSRLRKARLLLTEAGWTISDNTLVNADGDGFTLEFLIASKAFERIIAPFIDNLQTIGIDASIRLVDYTQYQNRTESFDFDIVGARYVGSATPGISLNVLWGSESANTPGSRNLSGLANPAVDQLINVVSEASNRAELTHAARALDRVVMWQHVMVPQWSKDIHTVAAWDIFGRPLRKPKFDLGMLDTWWINAEKAAAVAEYRN